MRKYHAASYYARVKTLTFFIFFKVFIVIHIYLYLQDKQIKDAVFVVLRQNSETQTLRLKRTRAGPL